MKKFSTLKLLVFALLVAVVLAVVACGPVTTTVKVINNSSVDVCEVAISSGSGAAGDNLLKDKLAAGATASIPDLAAGTFKLHAFDCDGNEITVSKDIAFDGSDIEWTLSN
jgi:hypothetical protein